MRKRNAPTTTSAEVLPSSNPSSLSPPKNNGTRTSTTLNSKSWTTPFGYFLAFVISLLILVHIYLARVVMTETTPLNHDRNNNSNNPQVTQWPPSDSKHGPLTLTPLQPKDYDQYTIRINTWKRNEQLIASVLHHRSCPGVAEIQVIWCNPDEAPPDELVNLDRVVIERHSINTLNERFHIIPSPSSSSSRTPTLGILSIDDDVLRPCQAIDAAFFQWLQDPSRILGFDGRSHVESSTEGNDYTWQVRKKYL